MSAPQGDLGEAQRADIWLFRARLFKSRGLAGRLVESGGLRVERHGGVLRPARSSFGLRVGDVLVFHRGERLFRLRIAGLGARRGPAMEAQQLYENETGENPHHV